MDYYTISNVHSFIKQMNLNKGLSSVESVCHDIHLLKGKCCEASSMILGGYKNREYMARKLVCWDDDELKSMEEDMQRLIKINWDKGHRWRLMMIVVQTPAYSTENLLSDSE